MKSYKYSALSPDGARVDGVVEGTDEYHAVDKIKTEYPIVLRLQEVKTGGIWDFLRADMNTKLDTKALSVMCSQFSVILKSGISLDSCLRLVAGQTMDKRLKKMLMSSAADVSQGIPLATAFEKNDKKLPVLFVETIRAGEMSGSLEDSFASLQIYYERQSDVSAKAKQALTYPMFVVVVAIVVLIIIMVKVVPTFISVFADLGGDLPVMTQILIAISNWFSNYWIFLVAIMLVIFLGRMIWLSKEKGRLQHARMQLKMPVMGKIHKLQASQQFANTMASLIRAGLSMGNALAVTSKCMDNSYLGERVRNMVEQVETGHSLTDTINQIDEFPDILKQMVGVGERTGEMVSTLETVGKFYSQETEYQTKKVLARLEPTMLIIIALLAGFVVIAVYLPMFTMYNYM
jgi:type IV pilus assembly protein PilC